MKNFIDLLLQLLSGGTLSVTFPFFSSSSYFTDEHIASFYLDPYSRPAEKRGGAWMDQCQGELRTDAIAL